METQTETTSPNQSAAGQEIGINTDCIPQILLDFCDNSHDQLAEPWSSDGYSYASTGTICVRIPRVAGLDREPPFDAAKSLIWEPQNDGEWVDLPSYVLPDKRNCKICRGTGKVDFCEECEGEGIIEFSNSFNSYEVDCDSCFGEGTVLGNKINCRSCSGKGFVYEEDYCPVVFGSGDIDINAFLLEKIKELPGVKIFTAPSKGMFHIKFVGGDGIVMGLLRQE